jgi:hypothetical protein
MLDDKLKGREFDANKGCFTCFHRKDGRCMKLSEVLPMDVLPLDGGYRCTLWESPWKRA